MPFDGNTIPAGESLGGSESAAYYTARELVGLGHDVTVFTSKEKSAEKIDGVSYVWHGPPHEGAPHGDHFHKFMMAPQDILIMQRHPQAFMYPYNSKLNVWWLHDLAMGRLKQQVDAHLINIDIVLPVSKWHGEQVRKVYDISDKYVVPTHNGVDYSLFEGPEVPHDEREPGSMIYTARPERGLANLVGEGGIMEMLKDKCPEAHLYVCGYNNTTPQMKSFYDYLWQRCDQLPNVTNLGFLGKDMLAQKLRSTMLHVYPTEFKDTSCIAVLEAQAAGTPVITSRVAALPETLDKAGRIMYPLKDNKADKDRIAHSIIHLLRDKEQWESLHRKALNKKQTWEAAARQWSKLFEDALADKSSDKHRLHRHLERTSDIIAAEHDGVTDETMPGYEDNYKFHREGTYTEHYAAWYDHEKKNGVEYGPEDWSGNPRFEAIHARVKAVYAEAVKNGRPLRVLDYGCAHGHYCMNLAARIPGLDITGMDIAPSNIALAEKWRDEDKAVKENEGLFDSVKYVVGTHDTLEGEYDLIIAAEVLEHVPSPGAVADRLMEHLSAEGRLLISVPYGPWESAGYHEPKNVGWRAHLHHFEREDLYELWGNQSAYELVAVPDRLHLGHFVLMIKPSGKPSGQIDYARKLSQQAPQETLSLCMIARNEAGRLGACLEKIKGVADEIIVGVDETTTDDTREVALKHGAIVFDIPSPRQIGFDAARNLTIDRACMDWILWVDADETLENAEHIRKYLRNNCYDAYAIPQHHFSAFPASIIQTDFPARLFRRSDKVKFYGYVHEHAAQDMDGKFNKVMILPDVSIMHNGYSTEEIRRKRFERNFPLMQMDRKKYPERKLGKMLWLRDLSHSIRYEMERNGQRVTADMQARAREIVNLWRWIVSKDLRMAKDSLPFYSHAVQVLGGGIHYAVNLGASVGNGGPNLAQQAPLDGMFLDVADIQALTDALVKESTDHYIKEYY